MYLNPKTLIKIFLKFAHVFTNAVIGLSFNILIISFVCLVIFPSIFHTPMGFVMLYHQLPSYFVCASSEGSGKTVGMHGMI